MLWHFVETDKEFARCLTVVAKFGCESAAANGSAA